MDNGSEGRFLRIETKLDGLSDDIGDLKVSVARIETSLATRADATRARVSESTYTWMIRGIIFSAVIGVASFVARVLGWGL